MSRQIFGIWCDDIRQEVGNKQSIIGVYTGKLIVPSFPTTLPKLCIAVTVTTPVEKPFQHLIIKILKDSEILAEAPFPIDQFANQTTPADEDDDGDESVERFFAIRLGMAFSPLILDAPCSLKLRAETEDGELKGLSLKVEADSAIQITS